MEVLVFESEKTDTVYEFISGYFSPCFTYEDFIKRTDIRCFTAYVEDTLAAASLVSFCDGSLGTLSCHFLYTAVKEEFRNRGINRMLKQFVESCCIADGGVTATAYVRGTNTASLCSLKKSGYSIDSNYKGFYKNGDQKILMHKILGNV